MILGKRDPSERQSEQSPGRPPSGFCTASFPSFQRLLCLQRSIGLLLKLPIVLLAQDDKERADHDAQTCNGSNADQSGPRRNIVDYLLHPQKIWCRWQTNAQILQHLIYRVRLPISVLQPIDGLRNEFSSASEQ